MRKISEKKSEARLRRLQKAGAAKLLRRERLAEGLLLLHRLSRWEDFSLLKERRFLDICQARHIQWKGAESHIAGPPFARGAPADQAGPSAAGGSQNPGQAAGRQGREGRALAGNSLKALGRALAAPPEAFFPHSASCPLIHKGKNYGNLIFSSLQKTGQAKKRLLEKIARAAASAIHFTANKQEMEIKKGQWEAVFDSVHQALCITDDRFRALRANRAFARLAGKSKREIFGKSALDLFSFGKDFSGPGGPGQEAALASFEGPALVRGKSQGRKLFWKVSAQPVSLKNERIPLKLLLIEDVSREINMEEALSRQARDRELGFIKGSLAHELNSPLSGIKALIHVIEAEAADGLKGAPQVRESAEEIKRALDRCQSIIGKLLAASRSPEAG